MVENQTDAQREHLINEMEHLSQDMADTGAITLDQAKVVNLVEAGFERQEIAEILDKNPNTVDELRQRGQQKIEAIEEMCGKIETLGEFKEAAKEFQE